MGALQDMMEQVRNNASSMELHVQKAREMREKYGRTRVVLSFGAADGGALLAQWMREELMKRLGWQGEKFQNAVYLDTVALSRAPLTKLSMRDVIKSRLPGSSPFEKTGTAGGLASLNPGWNWYYMFAIGEADVMVFALTAAWQSSKWCREEFEWFKLENARRKRDGEKPLKGIAVLFPGGGTIAHEQITLLSSERKYAVSDYATRKTLTGNYQQFYTTDKITMDQITAMVRVATTG